MRWYRSTQPAYSMHEVIERVVDHGSFLELQAGFACNAIVGLARLDGYPVGIVAQEPSVMAGVIDIDSSDKITRFVRLCDCYNLPIVTFVDSPGFLPGVDQEHRGIIRHGAKVLFAYSEATVPKISMVTRKAYGGAYVVMSSKYLGTDVSLAWPSAEIAVMGPEGAVNILYRKQIDAAADSAAERARLVEEYRQRFLTPYMAASTGAIDDVIEPRETRPQLIAALARCGKSTRLLQPANTAISRSSRTLIGAKRNGQCFMDHADWNGAGLYCHPAAVGYGAAGSGYD